MSLAEWGNQLHTGERTYDIVQKRRKWLSISAAAMIVCVVILLVRGLNFGVDFKGGIQVEVKTSGPADLAAFRSGLGNLGLGEVALQEFGSNDRLLIRLERQAGPETKQTEAVEKVRSEIRVIDPSASIERTEVVGPKVSDELATAGILSVILASLAMLVYIWVRFEWPFAVGAIATLVLDVTKTVGFFSLTGLDFNLTAIAALLTLVGYSVNDKVVVYDRMRENMRLYKSMPFRDLINLSINETLSRTILTGITGIAVLTSLYIFGGEVIRNFNFAMLFGVVIGTYSSIFIAAPMISYFGIPREGGMADERPKKAAARKPA